MVNCVYFEIGAKGSYFFVDIVSYMDENIIYDKIVFVEEK